jgi:hypothetical protein
MNPLLRYLRKKMADDVFVPVPVESLGVWECCVALMAQWLIYSRHDSLLGKANAILKGYYRKFSYFESVAWPDCEELADFTSVRRR